MYPLLLLLFFNDIPTFRILDLDNLHIWCKTSIYNHIIDK